MKPVYRALLRLYPYDYRIAFTHEMVTAFEYSGLDRRAQGFSAYLRFCAVELTSLTLAAPLEWIAKWTTAKMIRARSLPDLRMMRPPGVSREAHFASAVR